MWLLDENIKLIIYVSFLLHGYCDEWERCARKADNHTSWVAAVTQTDRPKTVRNRFLILWLRFCVF